MKERKIGERHSFERERARISLISRSIFFRFRAQKRLIHRSSATAASREDFCSRKPKERVSMGGGRNCSIDNCSLGVLIALATVLATGFNWDTRVTTKFGDIKGLWSRSSRGRLVAHYLGIPYALPPLGDLRFRVSLLLLLFACTEKYFRSILQSVKFFFPLYNCVRDRAPSRGIEGGTGRWKPRETAHRAIRCQRMGAWLERRIASISMFTCPEWVKDVKVEIRSEEEKKLRRGRILKILLLSLCNKSSSLVWIYESRSGNVVRDNVECCRRENSRKLSEQL